MSFLPNDTSSVVHLRSPSCPPPDASHDAFSSSLSTPVFSSCTMRRFDAALRRATPKGHKTFISCTAAHQESRLPRYDSSLRAWHTNTRHFDPAGQSRFAPEPVIKRLQQIG